jgi:hypothetical protein
MKDMIQSYNFHEEKQGVSVMLSAPHTTLLPQIGNFMFFNKQGLPELT